MLTKIGENLTNIRQVSMQTNNKFAKKAEEKIQALKKTTNSKSFFDEYVKQAKARLLVQSAGGEVTFVPKVSQCNGVVWWIILIINFGLN